MRGGPFTKSAAPLSAQLRRVCFVCAAAATARISLSARYFDAIAAAISCVFSYVEISLNEKVNGR